MTPFTDIAPRFALTTTASCTQALFPTKKRKIRTKKSAAMKTPKPRGKTQQGKGMNHYMF